MGDSKRPGNISLDYEIDLNENEEEKQELVKKVLDLQRTLDELSQRVYTIKEENDRLKSENKILGRYIENLIAESSIFQSTVPGVKKRNPLIPPE